MSEWSDHEFNSEVFERAGIDPVFSPSDLRTIGPDDIETKPAREPFEMALVDLATSAEKTMHVGDSHSEDVLGAHNAGFQSVWIPINRPHEDLPADPDPTPTYRVTSLVELRNILRGRERGWCDDRRNLP